MQSYTAKKEQSGMGLVARSGMQSIDTKVLMEGLCLGAQVNTIGLEVRMLLSPFLQFGKSENGETPKIGGFVLAQGPAIQRAGERICFRFGLLVLPEAIRKSQMCSRPTPQAQNGSIVVSASIRSTSFWTKYKHEVNRTLNKHKTSW